MSARAFFLACLTTAAIAQQAKAPPAREDILDEMVVSGERERERQASPTVSARNPDIITVRRAGKTLVQLQPLVPAREIRFRRESAARLPVNTPGLSMQLTRDLLSAEGKQVIRAAAIELAADIDEDDGLPALIAFGPHSSLINIDYVRLGDSRRPTLINVSNVIDPQTRRCETQSGWGEDGLAFSNRFLFISDELKDCRSALQGRRGDLLVADGVPEKLKLDLLEIHDPIAARFSSKLGSEPGLTYVAWRPESSRNDVRFELGWNRSVLLLFNGNGWREGIPPDQQTQLRESFTREQIQRRIRETDWPGNFTTSAVSYLLLLARSEHEKNTSRRLAVDVPAWIARCAGHLDGRVVKTNSRPDVPSNDCGRLLQFVYDAVARAGSDGNKTVYDTWRQLLKESYSRRKRGVDTSTFVDSSSGGKRIVQGLLQGSMNWPQFAGELGKIGVRLSIEQGQLGVTAQVLSLTHFHD